MPSHAVCGHHSLYTEIHRFNHVGPQRFFPHISFLFYKGEKKILTKQEHGISLDDILEVISNDEKIRRLKTFL